MIATKKLLIDYKGDIEEKFCSICKLSVRKKQKILQCPYCEYLFHEEHVNEWLENHVDCPVCNKIIRYDVQVETAEETKIDSKSITSPTTINSFYNHNYPKRILFNLGRILMFLAGMVFVILPIYLLFFFDRVDAYTNDNGIYYFAIIISPSVIIGLFLMIFPNLKFIRTRYHWKSLTLIETGILLERSKFPRTVKLNPKSIKSIELEQYMVAKLERKYKDGFISLNSIPQYHIKFRINMIDKKYYYIRSICQLDSETEANSIFQALMSRLQKLYEIKIITPFISKRS